MTISLNVIKYKQKIDQEERDRCFICFSDIESNEEIVIHNGGGEKHPAHKECCLSWYNLHSDCPCCRIKINNKRIIFLSQREGVVNNIKSFIACKIAEHPIAVTAILSITASAAGVALSYYNCYHTNLPFYISSPVMTMNGCYL